NIPLTSRLIITPSQTHAACNIEEDINVIVGSLEQLLARALSVHGYISQRVHPLALRQATRAINHEPSLLRRDHVSGTRSNSGNAGLLVDGEVLAVVGLRTGTLCKGIPRAPVDGEVDARVVANAWSGDLVLAETGLG